MTTFDPFRQIAHDLRAPLGAMRMWIDVLRTAKGPQREAALDALSSCVRAHAAGFAARREPGQ